MTPNFNTSNQTSKTFASSQSKGFQTDSDRKEFKKSLTIDSDYLRDPFQELENSDLNDQSDWWQSESFPVEIIDLFDYINQRKEDENADDFDYLILKVKQSQLSHLYIGASLRNVKFKRMWEEKYHSFSHFCDSNFGFKAHMANRYIHSLTIALIFLRHGLDPHLLPKCISHYEPLEKYIDNEDLLVAKWKEVLANYNISDVTKAGIKALLHPQETFKKYTTKIDVGSTELSNYITVIARLERVKPATLIKRLIHKAYSHVIPVIQSLINTSKSTPITEEILSSYRQEFNDLNDNFTPWFPNST